MGTSNSEQAASVTGDLPLRPVAAEWVVDPSRAIYSSATGIYVRAKRGEKWDSVDIAELNTPSLFAFLRSRGGSNPWAENTVATMLDHPFEEITKANPKGCSDAG